MIEVTQLASGFYIPKPKDETHDSKTKRKYQTFELKNPISREKAKKALLDLWDAMSLSAGVEIHNGLQNNDIWNIRYRFYRMIGELLLEEDCPEKEVKT